MKDDEDEKSEKLDHESLGQSGAQKSQRAREVVSSLLGGIQSPAALYAIRAATLSKSYTSPEIVGAAEVSNHLLASIDALKAAALSTHSYTSDLIKAVMQPLGNFDALKAAMAPSVSLEALKAAAVSTQLISPSILNAAEASMRTSSSLDSLMAATASVQPFGSLSAMKAAMAVLQPLASLELLNAAKVESPLSASLKTMMAVADSVLRPSASLKVMLESFQDLQQSPIFSALVAADPSRVQSLVDSAKAQEAESSQSIAQEPEEGYFPHPTSNISAVESEVVRSLREDAPQGATLSPQAWMLLLRVWMILSALYACIAQWNDFRESLCDIDARVLGAESLPQARKAVRKALCGLPSELTDSVRLAAGEKVNLRKQPGMKAEVILEMRSFAVLEVVDSGNRDWLLVRYKHEDIYIEGWVSRKFVRDPMK